MREDPDSHNRPSSPLPPPRHHQALHPCPVGHLLPGVALLEEAADGPPPQGEDQVRPLLVLGLETGEARELLEDPLGFQEPQGLPPGLPGGGGRRERRTLRP
jgi:hypothetical protein